ncbi:MAG: hypothetical protein ACTSX4_14495 [Candidatus Helarchaeota archaeon]
MKAAKGIYATLFIITIIFGAVISGLGFLLGYSAARIDIWSAGAPTFESGIVPDPHYHIQYGPIGYGGMIYDISVKIDIKLIDDVNKTEIGNGTDTLFLKPNSQVNLDLNVKLYNTNASALTKVIAYFQIKAIVTLFNFNWLSVDLNTYFNVTNVTF